MLCGVAARAILDSYTQERRPHVRQLPLNAAERGQRFWLTDPEAVRQRDARFKQGAVGANFKIRYGRVPPLNAGVLMKEAGGLVAPAGRLSAEFRGATRD